MAERLADETLAQIVDQVLEVGDNDFSSCADRSPFGNRLWSSANTLFVCKRWMRVGTPALYHTIILRSNAQAQSLMRALKKNQFGGYIRKLRLEGWFGTALAKIFEASTSMTDICFQTSATENDNVDSFCSSIGSVSPRRVIIWNSEQSWTRPWVRVRDSVNKWLRSLKTPTQVVVRGLMMLDRSFSSTVELNVITHLTLYMAHYAYLFGLTESYAALGKLFPRECFRELRLDYVGKTDVHRQEDTEQNVLNRIQNSISAHGLSQHDNKIRVRFGSSPAGATWASVSEHQCRLLASSADKVSRQQDETRTSPMRDRPRALQVAIWAMILRHSAGVLHSGRALHLASYFTVCHVFREAGSLVMHEHLHLWSDTSAQHANDADLPANRVLLVSNSYPADDSPFFYPPQWSDFNDNFFGRCTAFSHLQNLQLHSFPSNLLGNLASAVGPIIRQLRLEFDPWIEERRAQPVRFSALRFLTVICARSGQLSYFPDMPFFWDLPQLERLDAMSINEENLHSFTQSTLPRLAHVRLENLSSPPASFVDAHGEQLLTLTINLGYAQLALDGCLNLKALHCIPLVGSHPLYKITPSKPHRSLREINFPISSGGMVQGPRDSLTTRRSTWNGFLKAFDSERTYFPALERIIMGDYPWPVDASAIKNSVEVIVAEELMSRGFTVVDRNGDSWRPRLRTGGSTGRRKRKGW